MDIRGDLVAPIMDMELHFVVSQGNTSKSPQWNRISLEFYKTYWDFMKDDMLVLYNQMFHAGNITAAQKQAFLVCLPKTEWTMEPGNYIDRLVYSTPTTNFWLVYWRIVCGLLSRR